MLPVSVIGRAVASAASGPVAALVGNPLTAAASPEPSIRADPFAPAVSKQLPAGVWSRPGRPAPDASLRWPHGPAGALLVASPPWLSLVWRSVPRPLQAPGIHCYASSKGGRVDLISGGGGRPPGSPPLGAGHPRPQWRASPPPPAAWASGGRPGPSGWRNPETSTEIHQPENLRRLCFT